MEYSKVLAVFLLFRKNDDKTGFFAVKPYWQSEISSCETPELASLARCERLRNQARKEGAEDAEEGCADSDDKSI